jgi:hypothetical protein
MKLLKFTFGLLLLTCFACQVEDEALLEIATETQEVKTSSLLHNDPPLDEPWNSWDHEGFEVMMKGVGQVVAKSILYDIKAEAQFRNAMLANNNVVTLDQLLAPSVQPRYFAIAFEREYNNIVTTTGPNFCPDGFEPRPFPNGRSSGYDNYLDNILNEHCLELYMPIDYVSQVNKVHFTSHPLNTDSWNDGYEAISDGGMDAWCVFAEDIHENNGIGTANTNYDNLIIVRPLNPGPISGIGTYCDYTVYNGLNFSLFFD